PNLLHHVFHPHPPDGAADKQCCADRRVAQPDPKVYQHDHAKWTGSTPNFTTIGKRIGVVIRIDGAMSIRQPSTSSITLISIKMTYLSLDSAGKKLVIFAGICISAIM